MRIRKDQLQEFAEKLVAHLKPGDVVGLSGELGAGKTTLSQHIARALGIRVWIPSPTFTIMNSYRLSTNQRFRRLIHIDAYRLTEDAVVSTGILEELDSSDGLILIEWPERIQRSLPERMIRIQMSITGVKERKITISPNILTK
ncbi:MAG: tRNA (adenosine(37)-N6)-threonylcarbamoyltransferase complex ATPase subunit type 1 TsaE [Candidatus Kerfeldbacteria bacterium]|nr:tRNA (adenosine(37)-N6)-threonylcarbamoyltransferase complex ATPase subunit type 1 TsaE [Candidatus Kerfeldbacteria bacterium]